MKVATYGTAILVLATSVLASAQDAAGSPTSLAQLIAEAEANNPRISAAAHAWKAATHVAPQVTTLPDPKITYQQLSVGSPKPFAGYTNSDFAYIGLGASQELPFPGKLGLRGQVADRDADVKSAELGLTKATVADAVKADYLQLAYLEGTLGILAESERVLDQLVQDATLRYQVGQGMQQDVLQAQVERTRLVRQITMRHQELGQAQAELKGLLHRDQQSADIQAEALEETPLPATAADLLGMVRSRNPQVEVDAETIRRQDAKVASAKREGKPDFDLSYMYQNTDRKYRDYYMLTFEVRFPRGKRIAAEVSEAAEGLAQSNDTLDAHLQQQLAEVKQEYVRATGDSEVLKDDRDGLIPQADAAYRATLSAYAANREQLAHVLASLVSVLDLKLEYAQTVADHEAALARLETLTGAALR